MSTNKQISSCHHNHSQGRLAFTFFLAITLLQPPCLHARSSSSSNHNNNNSLKNWLQARSGPTGHAIWAYQGALYDPLNGQKIANVQGLELVRKLAETDASLEQRTKFHKRCGDLVAATGLMGGGTTGNSDGEKNNDNNIHVDYAGTLLSRKLFCYTDPNVDPRSLKSRGGGGVGGGAGGLLRSIRLRPGSPERTIPMDQAATVYDSASTFVQRGKEWIVHTEWPDGRVVWTSTHVMYDQNDDADDENDGGAYDERSTSVGSDRSATASSTPLKLSDGNVLEFSAYARPQGRGRPRFPDLTIPVVQTKGSNKNRKKQKKGSTSSTEEATTTVSPRRSALVQFGTGSGGGDALSSKFGARETYSYTLHGSGGNPQYNAGKKGCSVRYTRYGEGPIWYGPGRLCTLELTGKRVTDVSELPPMLVSRLAMEKVLGFLSVNAPVARDDVLAARAVEWFRGKGSAYLQVAPTSVDEQQQLLLLQQQQALARQRRFLPSMMPSPGWLQGVQDSSIGLWNRLRAATTIHVGGSGTNK